MFGTTVGAWFGGSYFLTPVGFGETCLAVCFLFQATFCGAATTVLSEAVAERTRFSMEHEGKKYFAMGYGVLNLETREFGDPSTGHIPIVPFSADDAPIAMELDGLAIDRQSSLRRAGADR